LWTLLRGEERSGVSWDNLKVIFLNLIGNKTPSREKDLPRDSKLDETEQREGDESAEKPK